MPLATADADRKATVSSLHRGDDHLVYDGPLVAVHDRPRAQGPSLRGRLVDTGVGDINHAVEADAPGAVTIVQTLRPAAGGEDPKHQRHGHPSDSDTHSSSSPLDATRYSAVISSQRQLMADVR
jgi:hypothetical protein